MGRFFFLFISILTFINLFQCKPADLDNACDVKSKAFLLGTIIRYVTGDHSPSCLPSFAFSEEWGVYGTSAKVNAITSFQGQTIVGGNFTMVGRATGSAAIVSADTGANIPHRSCPYLKVNGASYAVISDGSGGFYIGGSFTHVQGLPRNQVAHILSGCQLDENFIPDSGSARVVTTLALLGNNLYVGGQFTGWGSNNQVNIVSLRRDTGQLNSDFNAGTFDADVLAIVTDGSSLFIGGNFQIIAGSTRNGVAKLSPNTGAVDTGFIGQVQAGGNVNDLHLGTDASGNPVLYAVGFFSGVKPNAKSFYLNGVETSWAPSPNSTVTSVYQYENIVYLGGEFTTVKSITPANYLVGVDNNTGNVIQNSFEINSNVSSLTVIKNKLYVLGQFTGAKGQTRNYAAGYDLPDQNLNEWNPSFDNPISYPIGEIASDNTNLLVVSERPTINTKLRNNFAAFDEATGYPAENTPYFDYSIKAFHIKDNHLFVGGSFEKINGISRIAFAILDLPSYQLNSTNIGVSPAGTDIRTITSNENQIFFSGYGMTTVGGQTRNALAAIDSNSFGLTSWNPNLGIGGSASTLLVLKDLVFVGGIFSSLNGDNTVANYRAVDANTGVMRSIPSSANYPSNGVNGQTYFDSKIYLGGIFTSIGSFGTFDHIAVYDTQTQSYITPNNIYADAMVSSLTASEEGKIVVTGSFNGINGKTTSKYIGAFDAKTNTVLDWNPNPSDVGNVSYYKNGKWFIGGDFINAFNKPYGAFFISDLNEKK
ncbi:hypothetical protein EHQ31_06995 [Leptospira montravelensis]|uniref:Galactose oxidase n=1 Tax=Leptospira montravelensis TaxID=2484961 RepID=A0ABY2LS82_9LEPT|nr:hypothetical protein [Leptospira montravelensis]TGK78115.1 hypothetical protein EHQ19_18520 [Leptospira montravelensis]TGL03839.1 hypothetical protein EHQ31_06995 [Leptospira montravelensis]